MIRRISKNNDLKDLIKSCPSGVIDDITEIRYFISGHPETEIVATFEKVGSHLEAILPTSELSTLGNGVLMRRALYKVSDPAYPDGYYNLEFVDNLDVWLGDEETEDPFDPGYLTEGDLKTINGESLVGVGNIDVVNYIPDYYATKSWVSEQGYLTSVPSEYATQSWVSSNFLSTTALTGYASESWVEQYLISQSYMTEDDVRWILGGEGEDNPVMREEDLSYYATMNWVLDQGYITSETLPEDIATQSWVSSNFLSTTALTGYATESWVSSQQFITSVALTGYATESWVQSQGYVSENKVISDIYSILNRDEYVTLTDIFVTYSVATESWVQSQGYLTSHQDLSSYATKSWVSEQGYLTSVPSGYATESWVSSQQFITSVALTGYATESWVSEQGYLTSVPSEYATQSWVEAQGYLTSHQDLSSYATQSWVGAQGYLTSVPSGYATESWVSSQQFITSTALTGYATESWVQSQGYVSENKVISDIYSILNRDEYVTLTDIFVTYSVATESWVQSQGYLTSHQDLSSYATKSWVSEQGYLTSVPSGYATESWVSSQQFITSTALTGYATESWVQSQGYLTSHQDLSSYATKSWATSEFFEESKIWTGTQSQWEQLTSAQQALYTIALVTE